MGSFLCGVMGFPHHGDKACVSLVTLLPHRACFQFFSSDSVDISWHVQFPGGDPLEDSRSLARGSNHIIGKGHFPGLKISGSSHIHKPGLQMGLFLVEESQQRGSKV